MGRLPMGRKTGRQMGLPRNPALAYAFALLFFSGCATYSDRMTTAQVDVGAGRYQEAIGQIEKASGLPAVGVPEKMNSEIALGLLNRATLEQALQNFGPSSQDFRAADGELEFLDIANDTSGEIGRYFFSDSATRYRSSPTEKLALNGFNMMNYLALDDLQGARVESRRFTVMQRYLDEYAKDQPHAAFGSYLAGFTLERMGEYTGAMRYYDEALAVNDFKSLREPVRRLSALTPYRGKAIEAFLAESKPDRTLPSEKNPNATAEILVVVSVGRVPHKIPKRMPIGAAVGLAGSQISGDPAVLGYSVFKVVVYPGLSPSPSGHSKVGLLLDGQRVEPDLASRLGSEIRKEYESIQSSIIAAALSRMIVRAAAAEGMRAAGDSAGNGLGWALALVTEAAMVGMDKPDTRSWLFLPDRVYVYRTNVVPGKHRVEVLLGSGPHESYRQEIEVAAGNFVAVVVTAPR
jgi:tetratricopeptide (TPR) repeat protein